MTSKKISGKNVDFSTREITSKKVRGASISKEFSTREITSKNVCKNNMDFLIMEIRSKKVRGKNVDISIIEIM